MRPLIVGLMAATLLPACPAPSSPPRCPTTVLPDCFATDRYSDEACEALDDAERRMAPQVDATRAPVVLEPAQDAVLPTDTAPTFRWMGQLALRGGAGARPFTPRAPRAMTWRDELHRWTTLLPEAHAHCAPFSGIGYALTFKSGNEVLLRVEQSQTEYTPDASAWEKLRAAEGPIELTILATRFRQSEVSEGPFAPSAPRRFSIAR
jgi:hypothetical protein